MAFAYSHRPSTSSSSATFSTSTREQSPVPPSLNRHASATHSSTGGDDDGYDDDELQLIWDIVIRAQDLLPNLPETSRHPTSSLFLAYDEIVDERGVDPKDGRKLDKLLFKIGGSRDGETIAEKFQAVMARMNITVKLIVNGSEAEGSPPGSTEDNSSPRADQYVSALHDQHSYEIDENQSRGYTSQDSSKELEHFPAKTIAANPRPSNRDTIHDDGGVDAVRLLRNETALEKTVLGFEKYRKETSTRISLRHWQDISSKIADTTQLFLDAREADLRDGLHAVVIAWNEIAVETDELPLDDVPTNVYSKRIERIAFRTYDIYSMKNTFARWRHCTRERCRVDEPLVEDLDMIDHNSRLSKLARRAHENLLRSRAFTRWFNRVSEEKKKAHLATIAHEMGLKSRALGVRPKLEILALALRQRLRGQVSHTMEITELSPQPSLPPSEPAKANMELAKPMPQPTALPSELPESTDENPGYDERTMLARRHILRMRFFGAWEDYTQAYRTIVKDFPMKKVLYPWREKSSDLLTQIPVISLKHNEHLAKAAMRGWTNAVSYSARQMTKAEEIEHRNRVLSVLKAWIAVARHDRRTLQTKHDALKYWYYFQDQQVDLQMVADSFYIKWRRRNVLAKWRDAAGDAAIKKIELGGYAQRADYYRNICGTLRVWKARARENSVYVSMKAEALEMWHDTHRNSLSQQQEMERYAERANFYYSVTGALPTWREAAREAMERHGELQSFSQHMDYDKTVRGAVLAWKTQAKAKRKMRLKDAHLEVRRRVKKGMGARCVARWRDMLELSYTRYEQMNLVLEEMTTNREWDATVQAFDIWRLHAQEKTEMNTVSNTTVMQRSFDTWKRENVRHGELQVEAQEYWEERSATKALREWKLSSLQIESCRQTVEKHLNKDRKMLKQGFEGWYVSTAGKVIPAQLADGRYRSIADMVQDAQSQGNKAQAKSLFFAWRTAATRAEISQLHFEGEEENGDGEQEETGYAPTPGRPQLMLASLHRRLTTTPLAPIPQRQPWQGGPADSILGQSAPGESVSRSSRSRRNLRVSWAE